MDLKIYRQQIDEIDAQLVKLLADRFKITQKVGEFKKLNNLEPVDPAREKMQLERLESLAKSQNLNPKLVTDIIRLVINDVVKNHNSIKDVYENR